MTADSTAPAHAYDIRFPSAADSGLEQDEEWCEVRFPGGEQRRIRFHDYNAIYPHAGLYEEIFYGRLECSSPARVIGLLGRELAAAGVEAETLSALDLGAGNGMVGDELRGIGVGSIVGVDIIDEAAAAAERDRPGRYDDYLVQDLTALPEPTASALRAGGLNALTCVAALGFGDIPPLAFATAFDLLADGGWLAFNIREDFLVRAAGPFARLIREMQDAGLLEMVVSERYVHRLSSVDRAPLHYVAVIARRRGGRDVRELAHRVAAAA